MATGCESQRWGTLAYPRPGRGHGDEWIDCVGSMRASPHPVNDYLLLSKSVPVIPRYGHEMCSVFCGRRGLKNGQKSPKVNNLFLSFIRAWHVAIYHSSLISIAGPGIVLVHALSTPRTFFCCCCVSRSTFHEFPFFFFFSCTVALHKHWRILDHLTVSYVCFGDAPLQLAARFRSRRSCTCWLWTFSQRTFVWF